MRVPLLALAAVAVSLSGCHLLERFREARRPIIGPPSYSQYQQLGWQWENVGRVVVLPFRNESGQPRAAEDVREAFVAELQRLGRFEVVPTAPDDRALLAAQERHGGRFDEAVMLDIQKATNADVIVHGTVSNYSPYPRPRLGVVIQAVSPQDGKVIASVDGLWDSTDQAIAERIRVYYRQRARERPPWIRNHYLASDDSFAEQLALDSPNLYRRFVSREAALALLGLPVPGVVHGAEASFVDHSRKFGHARKGDDCSPDKGHCPPQPVAPAGGVR